MDPLGKIVLPYVPQDILDQYGENMYRVSYLLKPKPFYARCASCRTKGLLWVDLKFYFFEKISNCLCAACHEAMPEDEKQRRAIEGTILRLRARERRQCRQKNGKSLGKW